MDTSVPRIQLKRINPFMGLMIDGPTWTDAHDYHRQALQAHALAMHGWGIVSGLEVESHTPADHSVWIRPGVAVDPEGRLIIAAQPFRYQINTQEAGLIYLVLMFRDIESTTDRAVSIEDGKEYSSRLLDAYAIYERDQLPDQAHVELARFSLSAGKKPVKDAANPNAPKVDEIDTRYREYAAIRPAERTTVGVWKPDDIAANMDNLHLAGPSRLLHALTSVNDWRLRRRDQPPPGEQPLDCDLLLMPVHAKMTISATESTQLTTFLDGGGVMLVEASAGGSAAETQKVIASVAQATKRKPQPVKRDHPLLVSRHIFSAPPPGATTGQLFEADGLILSTADYIAAWNGGAEKGLDRPTIRAAVEFAENMLAYAQNRRGDAARAQRSERRG